MKSIHTLLDEAEEAWRGEIKQDFPLWGTTPVVRNTEQTGRDWTFSTDLRTIFAHIGNDDALKQKFASIITKYWSGDPQELASETLHYLLYHELYHPIEAPFSIAGDDNDNKKIHQAIRRGLLQAQPKLSPLEQVLKVHASQNGVKDFILDNRFALDNQERKYVREDIIPTWDVLELQSSPSKTNFYTVTRLLYGLLYGPESTHEFFEEKAGKDGIKVAEQSLSELLGKSVKFSKKKKSLVERVKSLLTKSQPADDLKPYVPQIREVFSGEDRYKGIERFMKVLAPYVEKGMPQGRSDMQGAADVSPQSIVQDLLDDMTPEEQLQFAQELGQLNESALQQAANQIKPKNQPSALTNSNAVEEMKHLDLLATHGFYKRNHPTVKIIGGKKIGESVIVGKREHWDLERSTVLNQNQLGKLNLRRIDVMQQRTRLPWLIDLGNGTYRLNEYDLRQRDIKDIVYREANLDVPDIIEFYLDSSGSMDTEGFQVNDGGKWDMLSYVLYGCVDGLYQAAKQVKKHSNIRIHNVGNTQVSSKLIPLEQFWEGDVPALKVLFKPENGYNKEDFNITPHNDSKRRTYILVTDGELVISGRTERESKKMKELARYGNNTVALFEIGGTYSLGNAVKSDPNIRYYQVHDKEKMLKAGLEVLLTK